MQLSHTRFEALGDAFLTRLPPTPLPDPNWVGRSETLASEWGLRPDVWATDSVLQALSGNALLPGSEPYASVYSGHQFGQWAGQLGDGRALMLGAMKTPSGPVEVQLKGAGRTPYSRMGDGRAVVRSSIREFLCSEAVHALGIPTTRALAVTGSPAPVRRETVETAAVVTRIAPSFIRFGHFEHFSFQNRQVELRALADHVIEHHYPSCANAPQPYAALLAAVTERTADLMADWQAVGFCHGVMNTDNMSILGLTLDYGPFQFMDAFDPGHICNHSDQTGRYAFDQQPNVAYWNLFCLGQALLPLLDSTQQALDALEPYKDHFPQALQRKLNSKLGLDAPRAGDEALCADLLALLAAHRVDHTVFWRQLSHAAAREQTAGVQALFHKDPDFDAWLVRWRDRLSASKDPDQGVANMLRVNPRVVLRNHLAQIAIEHAQQGDFTPLQRLQTALSRPFDEVPGEDDLAQAPPPWAAHIPISCSS